MVPPTPTKTEEKGGLEKIITLLEARTTLLVYFFYQSKTHLGWSTRYCSTCQGGVLNWIQPFPRIFSPPSQSRKQPETSALWT